MNLNRYKLNIVMITLISNVASFLVLYLALEVVTAGTAVFYNQKTYVLNTGSQITLIHTAAT